MLNWPYFLTVIVLFVSNQAHAQTCTVASYGTMPIEMRNVTPTTVAKVNGEDTRFLVDSGAAFGTMSRATAHDLGLKIIASPYSLQGRGVGGSYSLEVTRVDKLGILGANIPNIQFTVGGSDTGMPVLGANLLNIAVSSP